MQCRMLSDFGEPLVLHSYSANHSLHPPANHIQYFATIPSACAPYWVIVLKWPPAKSRNQCESISIDFDAQAMKSAVVFCILNGPMQLGMIFFGLLRVLMQIIDNCWLIGWSDTFIKCLNHKIAVSSVLPCGFLWPLELPWTSTQEHLRWMIQKDSLGQDIFLLGVCGGRGSFKKTLFHAISESRWIDWAFRVDSKVARQTWHQHITSY